MTRLRILVAEDNAMIGLLLGEVLAGMGHEVCDIVTTEAALVTAAARCQPDFLIVDAQLGPGSGVRAVEEILRSRAVPYVLMSGCAVPAARPDAVVLAKPFWDADLVRAMDRALAATAAAQG